MNWLTSLLGSRNSESPSVLPPTTAHHAQQDLLDRFYELQSQIQEAQRRHDLTTALMLAAKSVEMLPAFVDVWRAREQSLHADPLPSDWFPIRSIVSVETICRLAPARLDEGLLQQARAQVASIPELVPWATGVDAAIDDLELARRLIEYVDQNPGVRQSKLGGLLTADGRRVRELLYWLEVDGQVERSKAGNSYELRMISK